jgi:LmbE family N-acetylglucosaminyl deacetylase
MRVLVLCAHPDDEFGCGGTIARFVEEGATVSYVAFSRCRDSLPEGYNLGLEMLESTKTLGIENPKLYDFPVRWFQMYRQNILEKLIELRDEVKPDLVLLPSLLDVHQDHATLAAEGLRAFKLTSMLSYELPWNTLSFQNTCFIRLEERHVERKIAALATYKSQAHRTYSRPEVMRSLAVIRGMQSGNAYAEMFEVVRLMV